METKQKGPHGKYCGCNPDGVYVGMGCPNPNRPLQVTKQTAVEWLVNKINSDNYQKAFGQTYISVELIEQAKQMEKEQILEALNYDCYRNEYPENYYEERYGKEES